MRHVKVAAASTCLLLLTAAFFARTFATSEDAPQAATAQAAKPVPPPPIAIPQPFPSNIPVPPPAPPRFAVAVPAIPPPAPRLNIVIDPTTPLADLLPPASKNLSKPANRFVDDLTKVPEVSFQEALSSKLSSNKATFAIAEQLAKIRHVNLKKSEAFLEALIDHRADLRGMPFAMGEACRTTGIRANFLALISSAVRSCVSEATESSPPLLNADKFWALMPKKLEMTENEMIKLQRAPDGDDFEAARVSAVMQVLAPEPAAVRLGLVKYLSRTPHIDATKALAKLVLFSAEDDVRAAAIRALKLRRERDYLPTLLQGFRYPLPEVAKRAAEAVVRLECTDAVPQLVALLDESDPRMPVTKDVQGKKVAQVQEVVRVNHHRNCMLCHAPADPGGVIGGGPIPVPFFAPQAPSVMTSTVKKSSNHGVSPLPGVPPQPTQAEIQVFSTAQGVPFSSLQVIPSPTAQVPLPTESLPSLADGGYGRSSSPDIMVRFDVTYLRQDFSLLLPVHDAAPWPDKQRFDFLVRSRVLSDKEAQEYQQQAPKTVAGYTTPYQRAILFALRELTQRDTAPTSQAWRELLALPAKSGL